MAGTSEGEEDIMAEVTGQGTAGTQGTTGATGTSVSGAGSVPAGQPLKFGGKEYGSVEDLGKAYESAQSELGKWTQQHGDLQKKYDEAQTQAQRWNEWWQTVQPLWGDDVESVLRAKLTGQGRQPAQQVQQQVSQGQPSRNTFEEFDGLPVAEQFGRFRQMLGQELAQNVNQALGQFAQAMNTTLANKEQWYQTYLTNHLSLLRKALERKAQDPTFNVDKVMEQAAKAIGGQMDPIMLGEQLLQATSFEAQIEAAKKAAYEQGKKDYEQEVANKKLETAPTQAGGAPVDKLPTSGGKSGFGSLRQQAANALAQKFGPSIFNE